MKSNPQTWSDEQVVEELTSDSTIARLRRVFSSEWSTIYNTIENRGTLPIEHRRMEFMAAARIAAALGVEV